MDSLTDVVLHMNYTAGEGGDPLRDAAQASARQKLPGNGWIYLDLRKDFPDAWEFFRRSPANREGERSMSMEITRKLFPFLPGDPALKLTKLALVFDTIECRPSCPEICGCPCAHEDIPGSHLVEVTVDRPDEDYDDTDEVEINCVASADWPNLYHGVGDIKIAPIDRCRSHTMNLTFADKFCDLSRAFLLLRYEVIDICCETMRPVKKEAHPC